MRIITALQKRTGWYPDHGGWCVFFSTAGHDSQIDKYICFAENFPGSTGSGRRYPEIGHQNGKPAKEIRDIEKDIAFRRIDADNARAWLQIRDTAVKMKNSRNLILTKETKTRN